jgi:Protein of unknown function (DUF4238)
MAAKNSQRNVQQHFVTASYLGGFTPDGCRDSQLYVYERNTERMFRTVPDEAAKRRNYYSIPTLNGGFDDQVDEMLTGLEGQAMPSLRKLLAQDYNLSTFERALMAYLVAFQEFRTPWARANFQRMEVGVKEHVFHASASVPGYMERILKELEAKGEVDGTVSAQKIRDAVKDEKIKLVAQPHAGIDLMVSTSQSVGNIYMAMRWTVIHARKGEFLTSDTPVIRRNPGYKGGLYGGGLASQTAEVWFPLSKAACLHICHDATKRKKFDELLDAGDFKGLEALRTELPPIGGSEVLLPFVNAVNAQTIRNADRFVYSPFESAEIAQLFKGESQNMRVVMPSPFSKKARG